MYNDISYPYDEDYSCDCKQKDCFVCGWCDHDKGTTKMVRIVKPTKSTIEYCATKAMTGWERAEMLKDTEQTFIRCALCGEVLKFEFRKVNTQSEP